MEESNVAVKRISTFHLFGTVWTLHRIRVAVNVFNMFLQQNLEVKLLAAHIAHLFLFAVSLEVLVKVADAGVVLSTDRTDNRILTLNDLFAVPCPSDPHTVSINVDTDVVMQVIKTVESPTAA